MMCYSQFLRLPCLYYFFLTAVKFARIRSEITLLVCWHLEKPSPVKVRSHRMPRRNATQRIQCEHSQLIQRVRLLPYRARSRPNRTRVHTEGSSKAPFTRHNLLSNRLSKRMSNRFDNRLYHVCKHSTDNRFDNRLYRVNGA